MHNGKSGRPESIACNWTAKSINTWKNGVARLLKRYVADGTEAQRPQNVMAL